MQVFVSLQKIIIRGAYLDFKIGYCMIFVALKFNKDFELRIL